LNRFNANLPASFKAVELGTDKDADTNAKSKKIMTNKKEKREMKRRKTELQKRNHQSRTIASAQNSSSRRENYGLNSRGCTSTTEQR
jgi:hypothetical protein